MATPAKFLFLTLLLGVVTGTPITSDGNEHLLIEGGSEATPHEFPWIASLHSEFGHFCSGVILSPTLTLTSASCASLLGAYYLDVYAGLHNLSANTNTTLGVQKRKATIIRLHPGYPSGAHGHGDDIALLKMSTNEPWIFDEFVGGINLPTRRRQGQLATVAGWGSLAEEAITLQEDLRKAEIQIRSGDECADIYGEDFDPNAMICGVGSDGGDFCNGDVGGGLWTQDGEEPVLLGIASWGQGCGDPTHPSVYTDVAAYLDWIQENM